MIKNKSRKELIEYAYELSMERDQLIDCLAVQDIIIKDVSGLMSQKDIWYVRIIKLLTLPFRLNKKIKQHSSYFYMYNNNNNMRKLTENEVIKSLESINQYEGRTLNSTPYKEWIIELTGWKICNDCGSSIEISHTNFQREVYAQVKTHYPHLTQPISFKSSKYKKQEDSDYYGERIPYAAFVALKSTLKVMRRDYKSASKRYPANKQLIAEDIKKLEDYITSKTFTSLGKTLTYKMETISSEIKALKVKEDSIVVEKPIIEVTPVEVVVPIIPAVPVEVIKEVITESVEILEVVKSPVIKVKAVSELTNSELVRGSKMKSEGLHLRKVATALNVKYKGLSQAIKDFDAKSVETADGHDVFNNDGTDEIKFMEAKHSAKSGETSL